MRIAIFIIATKKYISFVPPLYESIEKHFLKNHEKTVFVFTDRFDVELDAKIVKLPIEHQQWPYSTLMRFHHIIKHKESYKDYDYYYYIDADSLIVDTVGDEILGNLVATIHPCFYKKSRQSFTYETRPESTAYIAHNEGLYYFYGAFNGGSKFLELSEELMKRTQKDLDNNIIALWHDESQINKYFIDNPPDKILDPSYSYPQGPNHAAYLRYCGIHNPKILSLAKDQGEIRV